MPDRSSETTVLLIEDDATTSKILERTLSKTFPQLRVVVARDGREGVEAARSHRPDVVILDWMMPDYDGEYFLSEQSKDESIAKVPVLLHTVVDEGQTSEALRRYPAVRAFIRKIMPPVDLLQIMRQYLALRGGS